MTADSDGAAKLDRSWIEQTLAMRGVTHVPTRLFKFVSSDSKYFPLALHELLLHNRIYLSCRKDFNDPFDTSVALDPPSSPEEISDFISGFSSRNPEMEMGRLQSDPAVDPESWRVQAQQGLDSAFDSVGIYSLADSVKNPLMWAHYASSHRGIALVFRHGLNDTFGAFPIRYQNAFPRVKIGVDGIDVYKALIKGESWSYEGEWRIALANSARQWETLPSSVLWGVVFGARTSNETYEFVLDLVRRRAEEKLPRLRIFHAVTGDSFELDFYRLVGEEWVKSDLA